MSITLHTPPHAQPRSEPDPAAPAERPRGASCPREGDPGLTRAERATRTAGLLLEAHASPEGPRRDELLRQVIVLNRGVAQAVASRYRGRGVAQEDLEQAAYEGLVKAVLRFDPSLRNDLLTYAVPTIRGELQRHFRDQGWTVRPPRRIQELQWRANQVIESLAQAHGREPSPDEVVVELGVTREEYDEALGAFGCFQPSSLDQPLGKESQTTLGDMLPGAGRETDASEARVALAPLVRRLSARDRRIIYLRFFEDLTQEEIGNELGVTQMQVSRLLSRIIRQLRNDLGPEARAAGRR